MIDRILRDVQVLQKADLLVGRIWLNALVRRLSLFACAALIAMFALGMANVAGFYALQPFAGPVGAAVIAAAVDLGIAGIVLLAGSSSRPGPEIDAAFEVRKMALESIQEDARDLKVALDDFVLEMKKVRTNISAVVQSPFDVAAQKVLVPAALSLLRNLRSKKEQA